MLQRILKNPVTYSTLAACLLLVVLLNIDLPTKQKDSVSEDLNPQVRVSEQTETVQENSAIQTAQETATTEAISEEVPQTSEQPAITTEPTKKPEATKTPTPTKTPQPTAENNTVTSASYPTVASEQHTSRLFQQPATQAPIATEQAPVQSAPSANPTQAPIAVASEQSASEKAAPSGGGSQSAVAEQAPQQSTATPAPTQAPVIGRITVNASQFSDAKRLAAQYGNYQNYTYEMSQSEMNQFLNAMKNAGISYVDRASGTTQFRLVSE